jgi:serine/threonine-protein kinase
MPSLPAQDDPRPQTWHIGSPHAETLPGDERATVRRLDAAPAQGESLPPIRTDRHTLFELGPVIGRGGMGVVRLARQPALRREVAVKELPPRPPAEAVASLVREARVAGSLEHPNIVPVHALCANESGDPVLVMKRIDGTAWSRVLAEPDVARSFGVEDPLEWHIDVLLQLCRAVEYAHSRGIVHLDLKPANVMVGAFGEVYLLDWGVAAAVGDDVPAWLPRARDIRTVCGTPAYMAPEMASAAGARIGVRSDVYMLGAILHEIVTGRKRHQGETLVDRLISALDAAPPAYGPEVPAGLAEICRRAMAAEPEERYASVAELRRALLDHRAHRASNRLLEAARRRAERILRSEAPDAAPDERLDQAALERAWIECRFGLEQARDAWPENPGVPETLQTLLEALVARALRDGRLDRGAVWLSELPRPVAALSERLQQEQARAVARRRELERLDHESDLNVHRAARVRYSLAGAAVWLGWNLVSGLLSRTGLVPLGYPALILAGATSMVLFALTIWLFRATILTTEINRRLLFLYGAGPLATVVAWACCWALGVPPLAAVALSFPFYLYFGLAATIAVDRRLLWPTLGLLPFGGLLLVVPDCAFEILGAAGAGFALACAWIWRAPRRTSVGA